MNENINNTDLREERISELLRIYRLNNFYQEQVGSSNIKALHSKTEYLSDWCTNSDKLDMAIKLLETCIASLKFNMGTRYKKMEEVITKLYIDEEQKDIAKIEEEIGIKKTQLYRYKKNAIKIISEDFFEQWEG